MRNTLMALLAGAMLVLATGASGAAVASGDWTGFGRTTDNMRHSPLTEITPSNVADLGRAYTIDFHAVDPDVRRTRRECRGVKREMILVFKRR